MKKEEEKQEKENPRHIAYTQRMPHGQLANFMVSCILDASFQFPVSCFQLAVNRFQVSQFVPHSPLATRRMPHAACMTSDIRRVAAAHRVRGQ